MSTPAELLAGAEFLQRRTHAYEDFNNVLATVPEGEELATAIALFLADTTNRHREALLACMSDRETVVTHPALLESIRLLLTNPDTRLRRMAALVLFGGGKAAEEVLSQEMSGKLPKEIAVDFIALFRLAAGVGADTVLPADPTDVG